MQNAVLVVAEKKIIKGSIKLLKNRERERRC